MLTTGVYTSVLFTGCLGLGVAIAWLSLAQNFTALCWGVFGLGFTGACVTTATVTLMPTALTLFPRWSAGAALSLGFVFVGLATLLTPWALPGLIRRVGLRQVGLYLGLLCLVPAALMALVRAELPPPVVPPPLEGALFDLRFWIVLLAAFLTFLLENFLAIWPKPYLLELGYSGRSAVRLLVGFWCAFLVCRFGLSWMIRSGNEAWLLCVLLAVSSMVLGNLAGAYAPSSGTFGFWLVGACYGPMLPVLLAILVVLEGPRGVPGQTVGAVYGLGALSSLVVQPLLIFLAKGRPARESMRIPMFLGLVMAAVMLVLALIR